MRWLHAASGPQRSCCMHGVRPACNCCLPAPAAPPACSEKAPAATGGFARRPLQLPPLPLAAAAAAADAPHARRRRRRRWRCRRRLPLLACVLPSRRSLLGRVALLCSCASQLIGCSWSSAALPARAGCLLGCQRCSRAGQRATHRRKRVPLQAAPAACCWFVSVLRSEQRRVRASPGVCCTPCRACRLLLCCAQHAPRCSAAAECVMIDRVALSWWMALGLCPLGLCPLPLPVAAPASLGGCRSPVAGGLGRSPLGSLSVCPCWRVCARAPLKQACSLCAACCAVLTPRLCWQAQGLSALARRTAAAGSCCCAWRRR